MPRVVVRLTDDQYEHVSKLAEGADVDDADIIRGFVELDMRGLQKKSADPVLDDLVKKMIDHLSGRLAGSADKCEEKKVIGRPSAFGYAELERIREMKENGLKNFEIARILHKEGLKFSEAALRRAIKKLFSP